MINTDSEEGEQEQTYQRTYNYKMQMMIEKMTYTINKYSQGIPLAEAILVNNIPRFIQIIDGKPVL